MAPESTSALAVLQRLRKQKLDGARQAFRRVQSQAAAVRLRVNRLERALMEQTGLLRRRLLDPAGTPATGPCLIDIENVRSAISHEKAALDALHRGVEAARRDLLAAMKQAQVADWLQQRRAAEAAACQARAAASELDDLHAAHRAAQEAP